MNFRILKFGHTGTTRLNSIAALSLAVFLLLPLSLQAEETPSSAEDETAPQEELISLGPLGSSTKLTASELDDQRAKAKLEVHKVTINDQELNGVVSGNSAINTTNGNNIVSEGAYSNSAGFISTVQNTGNNVLIQNSTIINVDIDP